MASITVRAEELIKWNGWFCAWNERMEYCHVKWMNKYGHNVDKGEHGIREDE